MALPLYPPRLLGQVRASESFLADISQPDFGHTASKAGGRAAVYNYNHVELREMNAPGFRSRLLLVDDTSPPGDRHRLRSNGLGEGSDGQGVCGNIFHKPVEGVKWVKTESE